MFIDKMVTIIQNIQSYWNSDQNERKRSKTSDVRLL
jgi:hypothetical protein